MLHVHILHLGHPQSVTGTVKGTFFKDCLFKLLFPSHPSQALLQSNFLILQPHIFLAVISALLPVSSPKSNTFSHCVCNSASVTSLLPFLPLISFLDPIILSLSLLSHNFLTSSFSFPLLCSPSLSLPLSLSLFAPSVFSPQGVLSQSEANLPNYKPHLLAHSLL